MLHALRKSKILLSCACVFICLVFYVLFVATSLRGFKEKGIDILPPEAGDGVEYENIAFNLYMGRGYAMYWSDPEWRAPFLPYRNEPIFKGILDRQSEPYFTAYRPPLYPLSLSAVYRVFGRSFFFARLFNFLLFYAAVVITAIVALRVFGKIAAALVFTFAVFDPSLRLWSYYLMTEPLATLLGAALLLFSHTHQSKPSSASALALAVTSALLVLTRTIAVFWIPAIVFILWVPLRKVPKARILSVFTFAFIAVISPWVIRNVSVIGHSAPLGTQGGVNLAVDYSHAMLASQGLWTSAASSEVIRGFKDDPQYAGLSGTQRELALQTWGKDVASNWIIANAVEIPKLAMRKLKSLWWTNIQPYHLILTVLGLFGLIAFRRYSALFVPGTLLVGNSIAISLTHNVPAGRFLIPVLPCVYLLAAGTFGIFFLGVFSVVKGFVIKRVPGGG